MNDLLNGLGRIFAALSAAAVLYWFFASPEGFAVLLVLLWLWWLVAK